MKYLLFLLCGTLFFLRSSAQCTQRWLRYNSSSRDTISMHFDSKATDTIDIFGKTIPGKFIDSVIVFLEAKEQRRKDNNAVFSDNRIFHYRQWDIILKSISTYNSTAGPLPLYHFLVSDGFNGSDWSNDAYYGFTYTKSYGMVHKQFWEKDMRPDTLNQMILISDQCSHMPKAHVAIILNLQYH